jgi:hypothetical protein
LLPQLHPLLLLLSALLMLMLMLLQAGLHRCSM